MRARPVRARRCASATRAGRARAPRARGARAGRADGAAGLPAAARTGPAGEPVPLHEQDRGRWDRCHPPRASPRCCGPATWAGAPGPYVLQAAIAVCHAQARTARGHRLGRDRRALRRRWPRCCRPRSSRSTGRSRSARAHGPEAGLALVDALRDDPRLRDYHLLPGRARPTCWPRLGRARGGPPGVRTAPPR